MTGRLTATDHFCVREVDAELVFDPDAGGPAAAVTLHQGSAAQRAERREEQPR